MLDMIDAVRMTSAEPAFSYGAARLAPRLHGYVGPERRSAASLQNRRMAQLLDAIDYGMVLMADAQRVAMVNKAARRAMDDSHPLLLLGDELHARRPADGQPLREAVLGAAQRGLRRLLQVGEGASRVSVAVVPLPVLDSDQAHGVALLLGKRQVCEELTVDWFARAHSLTLAETAVIRGLCADLTPQEIAVRQGVGLATIRTQIGSIRIKTGAGSIRALVRQVALLPPLVNALYSPSPSLAMAKPLGQAPAHGAARRALLS